MLARDISNFDGPLSAATLAQWKQDGVGLAIIQAVNPPAPYPPTQTRQQLQACQDAGIPVDAYVFLWTNSNVEADMASKLALLDGYNIHQLWIDCEDVSAKFAVQDNVAAINRAISVCDAWCQTRGIGNAGIYSGRWWWVPQTGNLPLGDRLLWDSNYDNDPNVGEDFKPYGDWTAPTIKQYSGTPDLDVANDDYLESLMLPPIDADTVAKYHLASPQDYVGYVSNLSAICDQLGQQWQASQDKVTQLQGELATANPKLSALETAVASAVSTLQAAQ